MINFLANSFRQIIAASAIAFIGIFVIAGFVVMAKGSAFGGFLLLIAGPLLSVSIFGALAVVSAQYEEIKEIKELLKSK